MLRCGVDAASRLARFAALVQRPDDELALDAIGLVLGDWDDPDDPRGDDGAIRRGRDVLDELAERVRRRLLPRMGIDAATAPRALSDVLFGEAGFRGATSYDDPRASFLGAVLDRHGGLPITLSVLFLEVARRVGVVAGGVALPGHFVVRVDLDPVVTDEDAPVLLIDPFHGGRELGPDEALALVRRTLGPGATLHEGALAPAPVRAIVARMLRNLAGVYGRAGDLPRALEVLARQAALEPHNPRLAAELASLRARLDELN